MLLGVSGYARVGKDTAADYLVREHGFVKRALADPMRSILYKLNPEFDGKFVQDVVDDLGWDVAKVQFPAIRNYLQVLGTEAGREELGENIWVDTCLRNPPKLLVISDVRFLNEVSAILRQGGKVVRVVRPGYGPLTDHASENALNNHQFDEVIFNDETIEIFEERVGQWIRESTNLFAWS